MNLPRRQKQLYDLLLGRGDVPIVDLYADLNSIKVTDVASTTQHMQRWLGPYITALNRNLADARLHVEPGALKNTYRLVAVTA